MKIQRILRQCTRLLRGKKFFYERTFIEHSSNYERARQAVVLFYAFTFIFGMVDAGWLWPSLMRSQYFEVLWPFVPVQPWIKLAVVPFGFWSWIVGSLICVLKPNLRWPRVFQALGVFTIVGLRNSDGHFGHNAHALLWISMVLALLPVMPEDGKVPTRLQKHRYIQGFWAAQFVICIFYLMTGVWKVRSLVECVVLSQQCELSHWMLSSIGALEIISYRSYAPMSWLLFELPWIAFFSYMGTIWIHGFSLHFAMRPNLHGPFGFLRVVFHLGTLALFGVDFSTFTWPIIFIFLFSPFYRDGQPFISMLADMPPFDIAIRFIKRRCVLSKHA